MEKVRFFFLELNGHGRNQLKSTYSLNYAGVFQGSPEQYMGSSFMGSKFNGKQGQEPEPGLLISSNPFVIQVTCHDQETHVTNAVPPSDNDDDFEKWQKQISEAEVDSDRPSTPPEGEEEFIDDDGTRYKWDKGLRAWVPQYFSYRPCGAKGWVRGKPMSWKRKRWGGTPKRGKWI